MKKLSEHTQIELCEKKITEIFGKDYIAENNGNLCISNCVYDNIRQYFVGIKGAKECPEKTPTFKDWVVYALLELNIQTGDISVVKCGLPS